MKKRIVIVTDSWAPQLSGVVNTLIQTISGLEQMGFAVDVVEPSQFNSVNASFLAPRLRFAIPPYKMSCLDRADAVHIATEGPLGWAAKIYCDRRGLEYSTAFHTNFPSYMKSNWNIPPSLTYGYFRTFHAKSAAVMVPTKSIIRELEGYGFNNCVLWGRGVDTDVFNQLDNNIAVVYPGPEAYAENWEKVHTRPYFLNVGRLSKEKNLDAFLKLDLPGTKIVVGEGPDEGRLKKVYGGPFSNVLFFGKKTGKELASMYRTSDVFVFPSRFDTFGLVNIEAIACGTPVAAFPAPGPIDIIDPGITGVCDHDLKAACLSALTLGEVSGDFSWQTATNQFVSHLRFKNRLSSYRHTTGCKYFE